MALTAHPDRDLEQADLRAVNKACTRLGERVSTSELMRRSNAAMDTVLDKAAMLAKLDPCLQ